MSNIKEKFKLYFKKRPQRVSVFGFSIHVDWVVCLSFFLLCIGIILGYSLIEYQKIASGKIFQTGLQENTTADVEAKTLYIDEKVKYLQTKTFD